MKLKTKIIFVLLSFLFLFSFPVYAVNCNYYGLYTADYDQVIVKPYKKNKYNLEIELYRLTVIDNAIGYCKNNTIYFKGTDASGSDIQGIFYPSDNKYNITFTKSKWEYLPVGTTYTFSKNGIIN